MQRGYGEDYSEQCAVNSCEVSVTVAPDVRSIAASQIGVHRRLGRVPDSKM